MKYCINFNRGSKILDKVDEINIQYGRIENEDALVQFCEKHKDQRINLCMDDIEEAINNNWIKTALDIQKKYQKEYKLYIRLGGKNEEIGVILNEYPEANFYFNIRVNDWDRVVGLIDYGVSDIYIVEGLGFELDKISTIAHKNKVQIRVFPNVAQSSWKELDDLRKFWIRPEDIEFYNPYIDVCEFFDDNKNSDLLYSIYKKDKKWFGDLKEIIIGLKDTFDSRYIVPRFVKKRVKCGRECLKGGNCQMCDRIKELSVNLEKVNLMIDIKNEEEDSNGEGTSE